MLCKSHFPV